MDPNIDATDIAVNAKNGVVTLTGFVRSYSQKLEAERSAKRVAGVIAVANESRYGCPPSISAPIRKSPAMWCRR